MGTARSGVRRTPQRVAVVGAGMVGLASAWFLQERGCEVTVLERAEVAAGASWGNAGWLPPGLTTPLPEPELLRYGLRALLDPASPVSVRPSADRVLLRFLAGFVRHSTTRRWERALRAYQPVARRALDAFDALEDGGLAPVTVQGKPLLACFSDVDAQRHMAAELRHIAELGVGLEHQLLTGDAAREAEPLLSDAVGAAIRLEGQRFLDPPAFVAALAAAVRARGGAIREGVRVRDLNGDPAGVNVVTAAGERARHDAVIVATGAWLGALARRHGVRQPVQAGRGYSFTVEAERLPAGPLYLPRERIACTPLGDRLRVAGMMELRRPEAPRDPRRIAAMVRAAQPLLRGVDLSRRSDEWVGSRPLTPDGLPLVGPTRSPRVLVAGGHGMWGMVLGPITGQLLAERVVTGVTPPELVPFDPLR